MTTENSNTTDLRLDLPAGHITFKTVSEFTQWLNDESNRLSFLNNISGSFNYVSSAYKTLVNQINLFPPINPRRMVQPMTPEARAKQDLANIEKSLAILKPLYSRKELLAPGSIEDVFIQKLNEPALSSPVRNVFIGFCYALLCDIPEAQKFPLNLSAVLISQYVEAKEVVKNFLDGDKDTDKAIVLSLTQANEKWEKEYRALYDENKDNLFGLNEEALKQSLTHSEAREDERKETEAIKDEYEEFLKESKTDWASLKATYDDELALKAPVTFWTTQKASYLSQSKWFGVITLGLIGFLGYLICRVAKVEGLTKLSQISVFHLSLLILTTAVSIWLVQFSARLFLSRIHLHTEASLRLLTINTYLSLRKTDCADNETINFMLQQVFRPIKSGLTKDKDITDNLSVLINALKK
jgi:hypothetical protein